jgi:hypothetical protein
VRDEAKRQNQYDTDFCHHGAQFARAEPGRFKELVTSIANLGLKEPITVSNRIRPGPYGAGVRGGPD